MHVAQVYGFCGDDDVDGQDIMHILYQCCDPTQLVWEKPNKSMTWQIKITKNICCFSATKKMQKQENKL